MSKHPVGPHGCHIILPTLVIHTQDFMLASVPERWYNMLPYHATGYMKP
jgi:hypothetical protein